MRGKPPKQGMPDFDFTFELFTMPLRIKKKWLSGTWTVVCIETLLVVIPLIEAVVPPPLPVPTVIWFCPASVAVWVWSSEMSRVTMSELPSTGVMPVRLTPTSRYSMLVVETVLELWFEVNEPAKSGMLNPLKIVEVRPSWVMILGVMTTTVSSSVWSAWRREPMVKKVCPLCRITSPITPRSNDGLMGIKWQDWVCSWGSATRESRRVCPGKPMKPSWVEASIPPGAGGGRLLICPANLFR